MSRTETFFVWVWRVNALLILFATAVIAFFRATSLLSQLTWTSARNRAASAAPSVGGRGSEQLFLGRVSPVRGTHVLRGELQAPRSGSGFGSGSGPYSETRNLLFIDVETHKARWLLPDDDHIITEHSDIFEEAENKKPRDPIAMAALVKPADADSEVTGGTLLLADPAGHRIRNVGEGVRELHSASVDGSGRVVLLFERQRKYVTAAFDGKTLDSIDEREVSVPELK